MPTLLQNKKVHLNYNVLETFSAGMELFGFEVKSLREKHGSLDGSYILAKKGHVVLRGAHIPPYQPNNAPEGYDPYRDRRLLLTKKEIDRLIGDSDQGGLTIVPISVYSKGRRIKIDIGIAKGRKKQDKREYLKKKDDSRRIQSILKNQ